MAVKKTGWWGGLFEKMTPRSTRMRVADTGDSTVWKKGQLILGEYVVEGELGEAVWGRCVPAPAQPVHRTPFRGEEDAVSRRGKPAQFLE